MKMAEHLFQRKWLIAIVSAGLAGALIAMLFLCFPAAKRVAGPADRDAVVGAPSEAADPLAFSFYDEPHALPELSFIDDEGRALSLADFRSRPVLLNIWATWCVPCRKEMPSLDRLQAAFGASQLVVLPLSIDRQGLPVVRKFYNELRLKSLGTYLDPSGGAASKLDAVGVPTTILINAAGHEVGRKIGQSEWDNPKVIALVRA